MKPNDDYLWDGSGKPDPEVERLERLLGRFRYDPATPIRVPDVPIETRGKWSRRWLALAAGVGLAVAGFWMLRLAPWRPVDPSAVVAEQVKSGPPSWEVARLAGAPAIGAQAIGESAQLAVGEWLETDAHSRARIDVPGVGTVDVEPRTRIGLKETGPSEHRLALERGEMHALVSAPPRLFFVDTPAATAVDLGCAYTLTVDESGGGQLHVTLGYVALEGPESEVVIPARAKCDMRPGRRIGTPYVEEASSALQAALRQFDFGGEDSSGAAHEPTVEAREAALTAVLAEARTGDDLTLWHLARRLKGTLAERVRGRMAELGLDPAQARHWEDVMTFTR